MWVGVENRAVSKGCSILRTINSTIYALRRLDLDIHWNLLSTVWMGLSLPKETPRELPVVVSGLS